MADARTPSQNNEEISEELRELNALISGSPFSDIDRLEKYLKKDGKNYFLQVLQEGIYTKEWTERADKMQQTLDTISNMTIAITSAIYAQKLKPDTLADSLNFQSIDISKTPFRQQQLIDILDGHNPKTLFYDLCENIEDIIDKIKEIDSSENKQSKKATGAELDFKKPLLDSSQLLKEIISSSIVESNAAINPEKNKAGQLEFSIAKPTLEGIKEIFAQIQTQLETVSKADGEAGSMMGEIFKSLEVISNFDRKKYKDVVKNLRKISGLFEKPKSMRLTKLGLSSKGLMWNIIHNIALASEGIKGKKEDAQIIGASFDLILKLSNFDKDQLRMLIKSLKTLNNKVFGSSESDTSMFYTIQRISDLNEYITKLNPKTFQKNISHITSTIYSIVHTFESINVILKEANKGVIGFNSLYEKFIEIIDDLSGFPLNDAESESLSKNIKSLNKVIENIVDISSSISLGALLKGKLSLKALQKNISISSKAAQMMKESFDDKMISEADNNIISYGLLIEDTIKVLEKINEYKDVFVNSVATGKEGISALKNSQKIVANSIILGDIINNANIDESTINKIVTLSNFISAVGSINVEQLKSLNISDDEILEIAIGIECLAKTAENVGLVDTSNIANGVNNLEQISDFTNNVNKLNLNELVKNLSKAKGASKGLKSLNKFIKRTGNIIEILNDDKNVPNKEHVKKMEAIGTFYENINKLPLGKLTIAAILGWPAILGIKALTKLIKKTKSLINAVEGLPDVKDTKEKMKGISSIVNGTAKMMLIAGLTGLLIIPLIPTLLVFVLAFKLFTWAVFKGISSVAKKTKGKAEELKAIKSLVIGCAAIMMVGALFMLIPGAFMLAMQFTGTLAIFLVGILTAMSIGMLLIGKKHIQDAVSLGKLVAILAGVMMVGSLFMMIPDAFMLALKFTGTLAIFLVGVLAAMALGMLLIGDKHLEDAISLGKLVAILGAVLMIGAGLMYIPGMAINALKFTGIMALFIVATVGIMGLISMIAKEETIKEIRKLGTIVIILGIVLLAGAGLMFIKDMAKNALIFTGVMALFVIATVGILALISMFANEEVISKLWHFSLMVTLLGGVLMLAGWMITSGIISPEALFIFDAAALLLIGGMAAIVWLLGMIDEDKFQQGLTAIKWITLCVLGISVAMIAMAFAYSLAGGEEGILGLLGFIGVTTLLLAVMGGLIWWMGTLDEKVLERGLNAIKWITLCVVGMSVAMILMAYAYSLLGGEDNILNIFYFVLIGAGLLVLFAGMVWLLGTKFTDKELRKGLIALGILEAAVGLFGFCLWPLANTYMSLGMDETSLDKFLAFTQIGMLVLVELGGGMVLLGKVYSGGQKELVSGGIALGVLEGLVALFGLCLNPLVSAFEPIKETDMDKFLGFTQIGMLVLAEVTLGVIAIGTAVFGPQALLWLAGGGAMAILEGLVALFGTCLGPMVDSYVRLGGADVDDFFEFTQVGMKVLLEVALGVVAMGAAVFGPQALIFAAGIKAMESTTEAARKIGIALQEVGKAAEILTSIKKFDAKNAIDLCKEAKNLVDALEPLGDPDLSVIITRASWTVSALSRTMSIIAIGVQDMAQLTVPVYDGTEIIEYRKLTTTDFKEAATNVSTIIMTLGNAIIDVYKNAPDGMFNRDGALAEFGIGDTPFDRVVKGCTGLGSMIGSIANGIKDYAQLRINTYDKDGKVNGSREMKFEDFLQAGINIGTIVTTLGKAVSDVYAENPKMFDDAMVLTEKSGSIMDGVSKKYEKVDNPFTRVVKACEGLGGMVSSIAGGIRDFAELRINEYDENGQVKGSKKLEDKDFDEAGANIKKVLDFLCPTVANIYKGNEQYFDQAMVLVSHTDGGWFGDDVDQYQAQDSPFVRVVTACAGLGQMISGIGEGIMTFAAGKVPVYKAGSTEVDHYESLDKYYPQAKIQISDAITFLCKTLSDIYTKHPNLFKDMFEEGNAGQVVSDTITKASEVISKIGVALADFIGGKIPTGYTADGKVKGYMTIKDLNVDDLKAKLLPLGTILPQIVSEIHKSTSGVLEGNNIKKMTKHIIDSKDSIQKIINATSDIYHEIQDQGNLLDNKTIVSINTQIKSMFQGGGALKLINDAFTFSNRVGFGLPWYSDGLFGDTGDILEHAITDGIGRTENILIPTLQLFRKIKNLMSGIGSPQEIRDNIDVIQIMINEISRIKFPEKVNIDKKVVKGLELMRVGVTNILRIFNPRYLENVTTENVDNITYALSRINEQVNEVDDPTNFVRESKAVSNFVVGVNKIDLAKTNAMTALMKSIKEGIETQNSGKVQQLISKLAEVLNVLTLELNRTALTVNAAEEIQKKRHEALQNTVKSVNEMIKKPIEVTIKSEEEDTPQSSSGSNTSDPNTPAPSSSGKRSRGAANYNSAKNLLALMYGITNPNEEKGEPPE